MTYWLHVIQYEFCPFETRQDAFSTSRSRTRSENDYKKISYAAVHLFINVFIASSFVLFHTFAVVSHLIIASTAQYEGGLYPRGKASAFIVLSRISQKAQKLCRLVLTVLHLVSYFEVLTRCLPPIMLGPSFHDLRRELCQFASPFRLLDEGPRRRD